MSTPLATPTRSNEITAENARELADKLIQRHPLDQSFSAGDILREHPAFNDFATVVIDLAYEEFCRRLERGESVDPKQFADNFPAVTDQLLRQLLFHLAVAAGERSPTEAVAIWPCVPSTYLHFDLIQQIGEGGSARVYLVADHHMEMRARVLKLSRSRRPEAKSLARLSHPSIVDALYCESDPIQGFTVLCLPLQGRWTLQHVIALLKQHSEIRSAAELWRLIGRLDDTPAEMQQTSGYLKHATDRRALSELYLGWARDILAGLAHAHERGVLHCDVKPSNILIGWDGSAILLDFDASFRAGSLTTSSGGTLAYMAPEQLSLVSTDAPDDDVRLQPATDLYGWAATFYELASLESPFPVQPTPRDLQEAVQQHRAARIEFVLDTRRRTLVGPRELLNALAECARFHPSDRPQSLAVVQQKLAAFDHPWRKVEGIVRRRPLAATSIAAIIILGAIVLIASLRTSPEQDTHAGVRSLQNGDPVLAYQHFSRALRRQPHLESARVGLIQTLLLQQHYDEALEQLDKLKNTDWAVRCRAYALLSRGQEPKSAVAMLKGLIESGRGTPCDYNNAAYGLRMARDLEDIQQADAWLATAIRQDPTYMTAWANRLVVEQRLAARTGVRRDEIVQEAAKEGCDSVAVLSELAMIWAVRGRRAEQRHDQFAIQEAEREAIGFLQAASRRGIEAARMANIEEVWSRLAKPIEAIRSKGDRPIIKYRFLTNPALQSVSDSSS